MTNQDNLGKRDYRVTVNCRIPRNKLKSMSRESPRMVFSMYHVYKVADQLPVDKGLQT